MSRSNGSIEDDNDRADLARAIRSVPKPDPELPRIEKLRQIVRDRQANRVEGLLVDMYTASVIVQVYDAVNDGNKKKMDATKLPQLSSICFKLAGRAS